MSNVQPHKRIIAGKVVTKTGDKSVTILVERRVTHPNIEKLLKDSNAISYMMKTIA